MCQADYGRSSETRIFEPEPDVDQHQDQRHDNRIECSRLHLRTDRGTDGLGGDVVLVHLELLFQCYGESCALLRIQFLGLEDHFAAACDLLDLGIAVTGHLADNGNNLLVDLFEAHVLIECDVRGSSAHEIKAVIESALASGGIDPHAGKTGHNDQQ